MRLPVNKKFSLQNNNNEEARRKFLENVIKKESNSIDIDKCASQTWETRYNFNLKKAKERYNKQIDPETGRTIKDQIETLRDNVEYLRRYADREAYRANVATGLFCATAIGIISYWIYQWYNKPKKKNTKKQAQKNPKRTKKNAAESTASDQNTNSAKMKNQ